MSDNLQPLLTKYMELVRSDHHKDRDCHFYINQVWSYGSPCYYRVEHYGYVNDLDEKLRNAQFGSYKQAREALIAWLEEHTKAEYWDWQ